MGGERETTLRGLVGLSIEPANEPPHHLVLKLGVRRLRCSLELDHPDFGMDGRLDGIFTLNCWLALLERLSTGSDPVVLLGYDFSDQYSGWLRVGPVHAGSVEVQPGVSGFADYQLELSDLLDPHRRIHDFQPDDAPGIVRPLADIVAQVAAARDALAKRRATEDDDVQAD
ncbi:hypothetical protein AB0M36_37180 [Actinoplanes sp. NPDC051346]|uniref:hypothetical protein n=1 Tax=Actinoplanes sp. NPDC051346 TaxID=3155048 RepID=UPI00343C16DD